MAEPTLIQHNCNDLINLFNELFTATEQTVLIGGAVEPLYSPAKQSQPLHIIRFTRDYFASALHEVAHWCIAGEQRRHQLDYGYWYAPDGRTATEQKLFEQVEVKPQAIEWHFSLAAGIKFNLSLDNISGQSSQTSDFKHRVYQQALLYFTRSLPNRAEKFKERLLEFYGRRTVYATARESSHLEF